MSEKPEEDARMNVLQYINDQMRGRFDQFKRIENDMISEGIWKDVEVIRQEWMKVSPDQAKDCLASIGHIALGVVELVRENGNARYRRRLLKWSDLSAPDEV